MIKYLNILMISIVLSLGIAPLFTGDRIVAGTYSQSENSVECHCETHEKLKNQTYMIDCATSDKLTRKSMIQARIIPAYPVLISSNSFIYTINSPVGNVVKDTYLSVDTPPPKLA